MKNTNEIFKLSSLVENLSHELRTPLSAILGYSELLKKSKNLDESERNHLAKISASGGQLLDVINDIIEISNIESGNVDVQGHPVSAKSLTDELRNKFAAMARVKEIDMKVVLEDSADVQFTGDEKKLKTIIYSLVNNAIKFTDSGSVTVNISLKSDEKEGIANFMVFISDTGRGIKEEELSHIFKPFWQADTKSKRGTGLGLTTCNKLVSMLNGDLKVKSEAGSGTEVSLTIPVEINSVVSSQKLSRYKPTEEPDQLRGLKALIVDDMAINRTLARIMLEMKNFKTIEAENGEEALNYYTGQRPDVVLMDISMPVMDGIEAMEKIRQTNKSGRQVPIIAITAGGHTGTRSDLIEKGFSEYIQKPFKEQELFEKIELFLPLSQSNKKEKSLKDISFLE